MPHPQQEPQVCEPITVTYACNCVKKRWRIKIQDANYPEPTEFAVDGICMRCEERADREGAAAAAVAAAAEGGRRRRAGLRARLRGLVRGRRARVPKVGSVEVLVSSAVIVGAEGVGVGLRGKG